MLTLSKAGNVSVGGGDSGSGGVAAPLSQALVVQQGGRDKVGLPLNKLAYKRWLLYVKPECPACMAALKLTVVIESDVQVTNVDSVPKSKRPVWLVGVPTLLDLQTNKKYEGTACLQELEHYVATEPLPVSSAHKQYFKLGEAGDTEKDWGAPAAKHDYIMPDLEDDPRYRATEAITDQHVAAYATMRAGSTEDAPKAITWKAPKAITAPSKPKRRKK